MYNSIWTTIRFGFLEHQIGKVKGDLMSPHEDRQERPATPEGYDDDTSKTYLYLYPPDGNWYEGRVLKVSPGAYNDYVPSSRMVD